MAFITAPAVAHLEILTMQPLPTAFTMGPLVAKYEQDLFFITRGEQTWASQHISPMFTTAPLAGSYHRTVPWWAVDYRGYFLNTGVTQTTFTSFNYTKPTVGISVTGTISGQIQEVGVPVSGRKVSLYYKATGQLIDSQYSDLTGHYTFTGLEPGAKYIVTAFNIEPLQYDAVVHDNVAAL